MAQSSTARGRRASEPVPPQKPIPGEGLISTRETLLEILKRGGESDINGLAEQLGISGVAVRQHIGAMEADGEVQHRLVRRPVGRPVRLYSLTAAAELHFPQRNHVVALDLLARMEKIMGHKAVMKLLDSRLEDLDQAYREKIKGARSWSQKLETLASIREEEGYLCSVEPAESGNARGGVRLVEHHCPLAAIASQHPEMCHYELELFRRVLDEPNMQRSEHIRSGDHICSYEAPKRKPQKRKKKAD